MNMHYQKYHYDILSKHRGTWFVFIIYDNYMCENMAVN